MPIQTALGRGSSTAGVASSWQPEPRKCTNLPEKVGIRCVALIDHSYLFSDALDGSKPWRPGAITLYFRRLRERTGLDHLTFHTLRKFMETYGQDLGFSPVQVAIRAGHDPAVARRHYTGKVDETDHALATAVGELLSR